MKSQVNRFFRNRKPCKLKQRLAKCFVSLFFSSLVFGGLFFLLLLFQLLGQKTVAVTGSDGLVAVDAKHPGNEILVELEININQRHCQDVEHHEKCQQQGAISLNKLQCIDFFSKVGGRQGYSKIPLVFVYEQYL